MALFDSASPIGNIITGMNGFTGDLFVTLFIIFILLLTIMVAMRIPIYFAVTLMIPYLIFAVIMTTSFWPVAGTCLFYLCIVAARMLMA